MLRLREFAGVSVAMSLVLGMVVFSSTQEYRTEVAPTLASANRTLAALANRAQAAVARIAAPASETLRRAPGQSTTRMTVAAVPKPVRDVLVAAPRVARARPLTLAIRVTAPLLPSGVTAAVPAVPESVRPDPAQLAEESGAVAKRVLLLVPARLAAYFDLYLYVSKAREGTWAQRLFVFHKNGDGVLVFEDSFQVSTGRERQEKYFTVTPAGLFELDPDRFEPMHISRRWDDAKMPWSMFFNYQVGERMAGIALHAAIGKREDGDLGSRASGGCVRLPLDKADALYHRIQAEERGPVPVLAFDAARNATSRTGDIAQDAAGNDLISQGFRVLVVIDDFPGPEEPARVSQELHAQPRKTRLFLASVNGETDPDWDKRACFG